MTEISHRAMLPFPAASDELGRWLWAMEDARTRTKEMVAGISLEELDWSIPGMDNTIGTILYHIALIECDYLCIDILGMEDYFVDLKALLPYSAHDEQRRLTAVRGLGSDGYIEKLDAVRARFLEVVAPFDREQLATPRLLLEYEYDITPEWVLYHMIQHESEHRGEIGTIRSLYKATI